MAAENTEFIIGEDQAKFLTQTNGDKLTLANLALTADQASDLAYIINQPQPIKIEISIEV